MQKIHFIIILTIITLLACNNNPKKNNQTSKIKKSDTIDLYLFKEKNGWGYNILINGKTYIHQPIIPGIEGLYPFPDKQTAIKTGELMIKKMIEKRMMHPTISLKELDKIGIDTLLIHNENEY